MAKGKKGPGTPFPEGVSGNYAGRPKLDYTTLEAKSLSRAAVINAMHEAMALPVSELFAKKSDDEPLPYNVTGAQALMQSFLCAAIVTGCSKRAQFFMSYLFGRPIEYDPTADEKQDPTKTAVESVSSEVLTEVVRAHNAKLAAANSA